MGWNGTRVTKNGGGRTQLDAARLVSVWNFELTQICSMGLIHQSKSQTQPAKDACQSSIIQIIPVF